MEIIIIIIAFIILNYLFIWCRCYYSTQISIS